MAAKKNSGRPAKSASTTGGTSSSVDDLLLADYPRLSVIALANDGRNGWVYRLKPTSSAIHDVSPASLVQAIRGAATMDVHPIIHPFSAR